MTVTSKLDSLLNDWNNDCPCNETGKPDMCGDGDRIRIGVAIMRKTNIQEQVFALHTFIAIYVLTFSIVNTVSIYWLAKLFYTDNGVDMLQVLGGYSSPLSK